MTDWRKLSVGELEDAVRLHNRKYWIDNAPEISDYDFDRLVEALREKRPDSPVLDAIGPEGAAADDSDELGPGDKRAHTRPMLSLDKCYSDEDLLKWLAKIEGSAVASPKIDGVAAAIRYDKNGRLELGLTRGSGRMGEVITANIKRVAGGPLEVGRGPAEVRGEVYMPLSVFRSQFAQEFANPRNLTAGAVKQKDPSKTADYRIRFLAYDLEPGGAYPVATEVEKRATLVKLGFTPVDQIEVDATTAGEAYAAIMAQRDAYDFETDGVVFKANLVKEHDRLGSTSHHPRFALAYKFQGDSGQSVLRKVEWSVSRTGAVNPVGIVEPVMLSGVTVMRASLHNLSIMEKLGGEAGLRLNSRVLMMRRGGVIPHVEQVLEAGDVPIEIPAVCPSCGGPTERRDDILFADHLPSCSATKLGELAHFVNVIGTKGFGPKLLIQLVEDEVVSEPADFYKLTVERLVQLERIGRKTAEKLVGEIDERRSLPLDRFLCALGIDELGPHVAGLLSQREGGLAGLRQATAEELSSIRGVGPIIAQHVVDGLAMRAADIDHLLELVTLTEPETASRVAASSGPLKGKSFLFTGELEHLKRTEAQERVRALGGETPNGVSKTLTHLVLGDGDLDKFRGGWRSSKLKKAEELNQGGADIAIIGETEFLALIGPNP